jgi:hypothetical protein
MATSRNVHDLLRRLAAAEERFLQGEFLAPALAGGVVHVRLAGVVCRLKMASRFTGWGIFRPTGPDAACLVRPATLTERRHYLELLPRRLLILCQPAGTHWWTWPAHQADHRFPTAELLPVRFVEEAQRFEIVAARCDGVQYWFEELDERGDPAAAAFLREALEKMTPPAEVRRPGLSAEHRAAYAQVYQLRREVERDRHEDRLREALAHGGAELRGYLEREDGYRVEFQVDGERHVSVVGKDDLSVQTAGICLSGADAHFDLQSLVGVLREAHGEGVLRIGADNQGMEEERYWQVHPRRPV